jgi:hypothetical protein
MVRPIVPQPLTNMGYGGMDFLRRFKNNLYNTNKMKAMNGTTDSNGMPSQGDQELDQRTIQNLATSRMLQAHHINPEAGEGAGMDGFTEPSLEDLVKMVKEGKIDKSVLGDRADEMIEYGTPSQREKQLEETGSLEIPTVPFNPGKNFLNDFIS